jgi:hypothetical protein
MASGWRWLIIIVLILALTSVSFAGTEEAATNNFLTEFDLTFWQTLPFAVFWAYLADRQLSPNGSSHWGLVVPFSVVFSAANAFFHAKKVTKNG